MRIDGRNNGFDRHGIDQFLKGILLPVDLVVFLDLEEIAPLGVVLNCCIEELSPFDVLAFEVLDPSDETHFGLGEHKRKETNLAYPFGGSEMAGECREQVNEVSNGINGGLSQDCVKWGCFHLSPDYYGHCGHCCRYCRHDNVVLALTTIT